jgi:hypothetical protein
VETDSINGSHFILPFHSALLLTHSYTKLKSPIPAAVEGRNGCRDIEREKQKRRSVNSTKRQKNDDIGIVLKRKKKEKKEQL